MELEKVKKDNIIVKNLGYIRLPRLTLRLSDIEFRKELFSLITPVMAYSSNEFHGFEYDFFLCYHPMFREVEEGYRYPEYNITLKRDGSNLSIEKVEEVK